MNIITNIPAAFNDTAQLFTALGDPHRQRILLSFEPLERMNILQIVAANTLSRTAVTHHLKILHHSGALSSEKIGKEVYFWINEPLIVQSLQNVITYLQSASSNSVTKKIIE